MTHYAIRPWIKASVAVAAAMLLAAGLSSIRSEGQVRVATAYSAPRAADGKPDLSGIWQVLNTAAWDLQDHSGSLGVPPGLGVVEGGVIPYQPWAAEKKRENFANRETADPDNQCFLPGVPRATYVPFPMEIVQTAKYIGIAYEYAHAQRTIYLDGSPHARDDLDFWMGDSRGRWEGDTLVVDVANFNDQTWFDKAGNFHSPSLHVIERYTRTSPDIIAYEATIEDPKVFTRPWKIAMHLYRRQEKNLQLLEYECVTYLQEQRYK